MLQCPDLKCYKCLGKGHIARNCPENTEKNTGNSKDKRQGKEGKGKPEAGQAVAEPMKCSEEEETIVDEKEESSSSDTSASRVTVGKDSTNVERSVGNIYVNSTNATKRTTIETLDPIKELWLEVEGCLDSGATHTLAGFNTFGHLCTEVKRCRPIPVSLADKKTIVYASREGMIELRTHVDSRGPTFLGQVRIFLVDSDFPEILIGRKVLEKFGCLPEQRLGNFTEEERKKEAPDRRKQTAKEVKRVSKIHLRRAEGDDASGKEGKEDKAEGRDEKEIQEKIRQRRLMEQLGLPSQRPVRFKDPDEGDDLEHLEGATGGDNVVIPVEEMEKEKLKEGETYAGEEEEVKAEIRSKVEEMRRTAQFSNGFVDKVQDLLILQWKCFALPQSRIVLSRLSEVKCILKKNAPESITVKARAVGAQMEVWLRNKLAMMEKMGLNRLA
eukprot:snap_masked-scaffold_11-processed-gene-6.19-mRNA-1 protein AED:1.00 eAED:1.00 QI:0/-1/0/0/-1/1/1/0/441